jgi:hypothetical protein
VAGPLKKIVLCKKISIGIEIDLDGTRFRHIYRSVWNDEAGFPRRLMR